MSDENVLTEEFAEQFVEDEYSDGDYLDEFTAIEDAAAESLSKYEGSLNLAGLESLSDAAAESLSKHVGDHEWSLHLDGLTSLSDACSREPQQARGRPRPRPDEPVGRGSREPQQARGHPHPPRPDESVGRGSREPQQARGQTSTSTAWRVCRTQRRRASVSTKGVYLNLESLTSLSDAAAESLSKHEGASSTHRLYSMSEISLSPACSASTA